MQMDCFGEGKTGFDANAEVVVISYQKKRYEKAKHAISPYEAFWIFDYSQRAISRLF